jgi:hypothetical protein
MPALLALPSCPFAATAAARLRRWCRRRFTMSGRPPHLARRLYAKRAALAIEALAPFSTSGRLANVDEAATRSLCHLRMKDYKAARRATSSG